MIVRPCKTAVALQRIVPFDDSPFPFSPEEEMGIDLGKGRGLWNPRETSAYQGTLGPGPNVFRLFRVLRRGLMLKRLLRGIEFFQEDSGDGQCFTRSIEGMPFTVG